MRRREFITLFGSAAAWPLAARAQQPAMPVVGFLHAGSQAGSLNQVAGFGEGLKESGYVDKENLTIEYRWADGNYDRLPALAMDLIERKVAVLLAGGGNAPVPAAKAAAARTPVVFVTGSDPVKAGLVASLSHPGGNITGVSIIISALMAKNLDLVHRLVPHGTVGVLVNPRYTDFEMQVRELQDAAHAIDQKIHIVHASTEQDIDAAFAEMARQSVAALLVANDLLFTAKRRQIIALAARHSLPAIYYSSDYTTDGGLMSYAPNIGDAYVQAGKYTASILKGVKPADLPVVQPTKFELVINLKTAKALNFEIPPGVLALADEVIE